MKKLVLLLLASALYTSLWASEPIQKHPHVIYAKPTSLAQSRNNRPRSLRAGSLQKVVIGKAGNLLSVLNANCHQIDVDSALNTVLFIHRADTVAGTNYNVSQFRYDISTSGGSAWNVNIGPLNPLGNPININGRYPEAVLRPDSAYPTDPDSAWIVYNGSWHNGASPISVWQGQFYGVGRLDGDTSTYTEHDQIVNNAEVEISTGMIQSIPDHYWNLNLNYTQLSVTPTDTVRGIIIEKGLWNDSAGEVIWSYQNVDIGSTLSYDNTGGLVGNTLNNPLVAFDPTGQYGWILMQGDITNDANFTISPIYMRSTDYGNTWSSPQALSLPGLPGMFTPVYNSQIPNAGLTVVGDAQITVDSAGNPHIIAIIGETDTTSDTYGSYLFEPMVLYDLYYNPAVSNCSWQANYLSQIYGNYGDYTPSDNYGIAGNRIQISRSKDGKKIFVFWTDSDSSVVASIEATANSNTEYTNTSPNLFGIGIDMGLRKITDVMNFTAGDPLFGGTTTLYTAGSYGGALFPVVSPNILNLGGGNFNIPTVLTQPDYLQPNPTSWQGQNPARFYYCQNINFTQSQFVNPFNNAPPNLTLDTSYHDTVYVKLGDPYVSPTASAYDCVFGNITPQYSSNVPTDANHNTDSIGIYLSTWTATNPLGNSASQSEVVIVTIAPVAKISYTNTGTNRYLFRDVSLYYPNYRTWNWGDNTYNLNNVTEATKTYFASAARVTRCVTLNVSNPFGSSSDSVCLTVFGTGINDVELSNKITVYPVPSAGTVTIELAGDIANGAEVYVYNMLGAQVDLPTEIKPGVTKTVLDLGGIDAGAYLLKIETTSGTAVKELTISK